MDIKLTIILFYCFLGSSILSQMISVDEIGDEIFIHGGYAISSTDGSLLKDSSFIASDYIEIQELQKFQIPALASKMNTIGIAFYDENQKYIKGIQFPYETSIVFKHLNFMSPSKTKYFRTTYRKTTSAPKFSITYYDSTKPTINYDIFQIESPNLNRNSREMHIALDFGNGILIGSSAVNKGDGDVYIFRSTDYGITWKAMGNGANKGILEGLYYGDHNGQGTAFIGTGDYSRHIVLKITNYGANWEKDYQINLSNQDIKNFVDSSNGCENVKFCGRKTWRAFINSMSLPTNTVVIETNDDGLSWDFALNIHKDIMYPLRASFRSVSVMSDGSWWGVGMHPTKYIGLWKSEDKGLNWSRKSTFRAFQSIEEFDGIYYAGCMDDGYVSAQIYRSIDKGETWKSVLSYSLANSDITYNRFILNINGAIIAGFGSGERTTTVKHFHFLVSKDKGDTWKDYGERPTQDFNLAYIDNPIYQNGRAILCSMNGLYTF